MILRPYPKETILLQSYDYFGTKNRIVTIFSMIASGTSGVAVNVQNVPLMAESVVADLMLLRNESKEPIKILINSIGGSVAAGLLIIHAIEHLQADGIDIETVVFCESLSMATPILASGTPGKRYAFHRAVIHGHRGQGGATGSIDDMQGQVKYAGYLFDQLYEILARRTRIPEYHLTHSDSDTPTAEILEMLVQLEKSGKPEDQARRLKLRMKYVKEFFARENFLTAEQAQEAGIIDRVLEPGDPYLNEIFRPASDQEEKQ